MIMLSWKVEDIVQYGCVTVQRESLKEAKLAAYIIMVVALWVLLQAENMAKFLYVAEELCKYQGKKQK